MDNRALAEIVLELSSSLRYTPISSISEIGGVEFLSIKFTASLVSAKVFATVSFWFEGNKFWLIFFPM